MRANTMQPMPYGFDGPFSVPAPTANGGGFQPVGGLTAMLNRYRGG